MISSILRKIILLITVLLLTTQTFASYILIPMDAETQDNHLKAYGITYWTLKQNVKL